MYCTIDVNGTDTEKETVTGCGAPEKNKAPKKNRRKPVAVLAAIFLLLGWTCIPAFAQEPAAELPGDTNGSGRITAWDARLALRASVGLVKLVPEAAKRADLDMDGEVTAADARGILRMAVGLDSNVPLAGPDAVAAVMTKKTSYDRLSSNMSFLTEELGIRSWWNDTQNNAAERIADRLRGFGLPANAVRVQRFTWDGREGKNVIVTFPSKTSSRIVLFCAHYDTCRETVGAVDNASGSATLLELARVLSLSPRAFNAEVRLVFTAGEEQGYYGAKGYLRSLPDAELSRLSFVFNYDMTGAPNDDVTYYLAVSTQPVSTDGYHAPAASENAGSRALDRARLALGDPAEWQYLSPVRAGVHDIVPFCARGIPALTLSWRCVNYDRSSGADHGFAALVLTHQPRDNLDHFDMYSLYITTRLAVYAAVVFLLQT